MSANPNWGRWVFATLSKHFETAALAAGFKYFCEGDIRLTQEQQDYFEFRMNGPLIQEVSKDYWRLDFEINILAVSKDVTDFHKSMRMTGVISEAFAKSIPAFRYGDDPIIDDQGLFGCLYLCKRLDDNIVVSNLGRLAPDLAEMQGTVEGYYRMNLDT